MHIYMFFHSLIKAKQHRIEKKINEDDRNREEAIDVFLLGFVPSSLYKKKFHPSFSCFSSNKRNILSFVPLKKKWKECL